MGQKEASYKINSYYYYTYSIPFIHIGSLGAFLFFCLGKQSENNEALNSE